MISCRDCKYWLEHADGKYGACQNEKHIRDEIKNMQNAYRNQPAHQAVMLKYFEPYITDKYHRCMDGERDE